jgi:hypothetical protein
LALDDVVRCDSLKVARNGTVVQIGRNRWQDTARLMVFKLVMAASKTWRRLKGQNQLPKVISGVRFKDGIEVASEIKFAA